MAAECFVVAHKANEDTVTTVDLKADSILREGLAMDFSGPSWVLEETRDNYSRLDMKIVWIVDTIDGTKEFVSGIPKYPVSVALVEQ
jgi:myo-inositol-1(or 4)-monophosphatase